MLTALEMPRITNELQVSDDFMVKDTEYIQYAGVYFTRLQILRQRLSSTMAVHVQKVLDVLPGQTAFILGTIYLDAPLKPNVLDSVTRNVWECAPPAREKYLSVDDVVYLEDESGRVKLIIDSLESGTIETLIKVWVTGTVLGFIGVETPQGDFRVQHVVYPSYKPRISPLMQLSSTKLDLQESWIALVSGLHLGLNLVDLSIQLLVDFLTADKSISDEDVSVSKLISRLIIVGNSIAPVVRTDKEVRNKFGQEVSTFDGSPLRIFDSILYHLCANLDVDLMPGSSDPCHVFLPQKPWHKSILPKSSTLSTFKTVTNPYKFNLGEASYLGTSGQNIDDVFKYVESEDRLLIAEKMLDWAHIAPTAPDTLNCHPFKDSDPFILTERPDVFFMGNQPSYQSKLVESAYGNTRIILVPEFTKTKSIVLLNVKTFETRSVSFQV